MSAAGLSRSLAGKRPLTLFAPTNEAFADLNGLADLLNNRNDIRAVSPQSYLLVTWRVESSSPCRRVEDSSV
jgi:hypothetical protein